MKATLDRIENGLAVILVKSEDLPAGTKEGSVLEVSFNSLPLETSNQKRKVQKALDSLFGK